jgi:hypothetical protein
MIPKLFSKRAIMTVTRQHVNALMASSNMPHRVEAILCPIGRCPARKSIFSQKRKPIGSASLRVGHKLLVQP